MYCTIFFVRNLCCSSSAKMKGLYTIQLFPWSSLYLLTRWFSLLVKVGSATATPPQSLPPITTLPYPHHSPFFRSLKFFLLHSLDPFTIGGFLKSLQGAMFQLSSGRNEFLLLSSFMKLSI